jgi:hypothetical protein
VLTTYEEAHSHPVSTRSPFDVLFLYHIEKIISRRKKIDILTR